MCTSRLSVGTTVDIAVDNFVDSEAARLAGGARGPGSRLQLMQRFTRSVSRLIEMFHVKPPRYRLSNEKQFNNSPKVA